MMSIKKGNKCSKFADEQWEGITNTLWTSYMEAPFHSRSSWGRQQP